MFEFKSVKTRDVGGGMYIYWGQMSDGQYFISNGYSDEVDILFLDTSAQPYTDDIDDGFYDWDWLDSHVMDSINVYSDNYLIFFDALYTYCKENHINTPDVRQGINAISETLSMWSDDDPNFIVEDLGLVGKYDIHLYDY